MLCIADKCFVCRQNMGVMMLIFASLMFITGCKSEAQKIADGIKNAKTADEEKQAFSKAAASSLPYSIRFFDKSGKELILHKQEDYLEIETIQVLWSEKTTVTSRLHDRNNLKILMMDYNGHPISAFTKIVWLVALVSLLTIACILFWWIRHRGQISAPPGFEVSTEQGSGH